MIYLIFRFIFKIHGFFNQYVGGLENIDNDLISAIEEIRKTHSNVTDYLCSLIILNKFSQHNPVNGSRQLMIDDDFLSREKFISSITESGKLFIYKIVFP